MTIPAATKTWQFQVNQTVTAQGSVAATEKALILLIKNLLKGFGQSPWTVRGSSNSVAAGMDGVDRWATVANIVKANNGVAHSWIVLRQAGMNGGTFELCLDMNQSSDNVMTVVVSPSAGFTGGSTTARPTATDENSTGITAGVNNWFSGVDTTHQVHMMQSTDGACTRMCIWRGGTNMCTYYQFDTLANPPSGWTTPSVYVAVGATSGICINTTNLQTVPKIRGINATNQVVIYTAECTLGGTTLLSLGTTVSDFDSNWSTYPVGAFCNVAGTKGRCGTMFDFYWKPAGVSDADSFPNDANARSWMALGPLVWPWTGTSTQALLA